ncbi:hypothetical protein [Streptomyces sp. NRRL B-24484]|uniref:hypothetical protein n=1 Tax=Streptomyces sp. NRRL B-24484 TaxID=1463833 RepID=UPI0004C19A79|nr:hypothetical protein [Streptomyces sp. NRRL B-24484]
MQEPRRRCEPFGPRRRGLRPAKIDGRPDGGPADGPAALSLLRDPDRLFTALEACTLSEEAARLPRMSWDDLVTARAAVDSEGWSRPLRVATARALRPSDPDTDTPQAADRSAGGAAPDELPGLDGILDAFDRGLLWPTIADRFPRPPQAGRLTGVSARNFVRPKIFDALAGMVQLHLTAAGETTPDIAWAGRPGVTLPDVWEEHLDDALDAAVADTPDTAPLRALLARTRPTPA